MTDKHLSAYYFMSTDLCMNRAHVREDMAWLKDHAFDAIHIACHEEHHHMPKGIHLIIDEAHAAGIKVYAIPSRWCGLIAGWPILAGHFAASRPDVWMVKEDGSPMIKNFCGPLCSVHHPDVQAHMVQCVETMLKTFDFDGITWDELKTLHETDYHPLAIEKYGHPVSGDEQIKATLDIFAQCNRKARTIKPDYSKFLLDQQERFNRIAADHGRRSFALIETQNALVSNAETTLQRLPEYLTMAPDHIAVYYKPLVDEPAAEITDKIGPILRDWRLS